MLMLLTCGSKGDGNGGREMEDGERGTERREYVICTVYVYVCVYIFNIWDNGYSAKMKGQNRTRPVTGKCRAG
jgi:hypothetical protein